jgi:hypothetical protein
MNPYEDQERYAMLSAKDKQHESRATTITSVAAILVSVAILLVLHFTAAQPGYHHTDFMHVIHN